MSLTTISFDSKPTKGKLPSERQKLCTMSLFYNGCFSAKTYCSCHVSYISKGNGSTWIDSCQWYMSGGSIMGAIAAHSLSIYKHYAAIKNLDDTSVQQCRYISVIIFFFILFDSHYILAQCIVYTYWKKNQVQNTWARHKRVIWYHM